MNQQRRLQKLQELLLSIQNADLSHPETRATHLAAARRAINKLLRANDESIKEVKKLLGTIHLSQAMLSQLLEGTEPESKDQG